ncbi:MAG: YhbY family RNA-binding protein [Candidatus Altiarchaeota archaeon]|nr:YhbY family RNA-binding protein [Candidatus Altiarchaeota archaeon]
MGITLFVGKAGVDAIVEEAKSQLKSKKEIKVKVNPPIIEGRMHEFARKIADELAEKTNSKVLWVKGRTFVLKCD